MIIGLTGFAGSGKSTIAGALEMRGFRRAKFAAPLKDMMRSLLRSQGCGAEYIERLIEGALKEVPCEHLNGATPRHAMQTLGTDWGRAMICENLWSDAATRGLNPGHKVAFDDVRFQNEADAIRALGGKVVRLHRPGVERMGTHVSEDPPWADVEVTNDRNAVEVADQIIKAVRSLG